MKRKRLKRKNRILNYLFIITFVIISFSNGCERKAEYPTKIVRQPIKEKIEIKVKEEKKQEIKKEETKKLEQDKSKSLIVKQTEKPKEYMYNPLGKPDPFKSFLVLEKTEKKISKEFIQPLQRYDINQIRLVGIIWGTNDIRALIEDPAGFGYTVKKGTLIGKNNGFVKSVRKDEIIIEEQIRDILGSKKTKQISIKLHKPE